MSDTPQGGWWKASDGKWYPPEVHPDRMSAAAATGGDVAEEPPERAPVTPTEPAAELPQSDAPLPGWKKGADGHWYPPHLEPPSVRSSSRPSSGSGGRNPAAATERAPGTSTRSRRPLVLIAVLVAVVALAGLGWLLLGGDDGSEVAGTTTSPPTTSTADTSAPTTQPAEGPSGSASTTTTPPPPGQLNGDGAAEVGVGATVEAPYLALVTHDGPGSFDLTLVAEGGVTAQSPLGGAVSGNYLGVLPVNFGPNESFDAARVVGDGPWAVTFALVDSAPVLDTTTGATFQGRGDQVLQLRGDAEITVAVTCTTCAPGISLHAWSATGVPSTRVVVNGATAVVPAGTRYLQVTARSGAGTSAPDWSLGVG